MFWRRRTTTTTAPVTTTTEHVRPRRPLTYLLATLLTLTGALLLWLSAFSTPYINSIYYVGLGNGDGDRLGTFGYCGGEDGDSCISPRVGYRYPWVPSSKALTGSLILTAIAAGLASLALLGLLHAYLKAHRAGFLNFLMLLLATFLAILSYILALIAFVTFHHRADDNDADPDYGPAMWLHLAGTLALILGVPLALIGWFQARRHRRHSKVVTSNTY